MTRLALVALLLLPVPAAATVPEPYPDLDPIASGFATYYAPGLMRTVMRNRGLDCPECVGGIALLTCKRLGDRLWVRRAGRAPIGPLLVADCGGHGLPFPLWVADVDYSTGQALGMHGPVYVTIMEETRQ